MRVDDELEIAARRGVQEPRLMHESPGGSGGNESEAVHQGTHQGTAEENAGTRHMGLIRSGVDACVTKQRSAGSRRKATELAMIGQSQEH